jgi:hypothetical protein
MLAVPEGASKVAAELLRRLAQEPSKSSVQRGGGNEALSFVLHAFFGWSM